MTMRLPVLLLAAVLCLVVHAHEAATIVPTPVQLIEGTGTCKLDTVTVDCRDAALLPAAQYLAQSLAGRATVAATGGRATSVKLALDTTLEASQYRLDIAPGHIDITGGDYSGVACGIASIEGLQGWFVRQLEAYFNAKGRHLVGWDEIADDGLGTGSVVQWWRGWNKGVVERATVQGKQVICSPTTCLYFDYGQDDGTIDEILRYDPRSTAGLSAGQQQLILGMQGNTWCEWIATEARLQYQVMPRMIALAERAWTSDTCRERVVARFHEKLPAQLERLDALHVRYKLPDITGVSEHTLYNGHGVLWPAIAYGKATLRYTTDGTVPTCQSPAITGPVEVTRDTHFTIASFRPDGSRSDMLTATYAQARYMPALDVSPMTDGLLVEWHRNTGGDHCSDIARGALIARLVSPAVQLPPAIDHDYSVIFKGYLYAPADGIYEFALGSDDGSQWLIDGTLLIDNDGPHSTVVRRNQAALRQGWHATEVHYFDYNDNGGTLHATVRCVDNSALQVTYKH